MRRRATASWTDGGETQGAAGIHVDAATGLSAIAPSYDGPGYRSAIRRSVVAGD